MPFTTTIQDHIVKVIAFAAALLATTAAAEDKKDEVVNCSADRLDKSWNIIVKSATAKEVSKESLGDLKFGSPKTFIEIRVTLEFAKNAASPKEVNSVFLPESKLPKPGDVAKDDHIQLYLADADGIVLKHLNPLAIEGELTGKAGDAFRMVFYCDPELFKKVKKMDLRRSVRK
jgi:hypothetical protein